MHMARKKPRKSPPGRPRRHDRSPPKSDLDRRVEDFSEEVGRIGESFGKGMERMGDDWSRRGCRSHSWFRHTFGILGPLLSSILGIVLLSLLVWVIIPVNAAVQSDMLANIHLFLSGNLGFFFLLMLFFSYASYISECCPRAYFVLSPLITAVSIVIAFWIAAQAISIVNFSLAIPTLSMVSLYIMESIPFLFAVGLLLGLVGVILRQYSKGAASCCPPHVAGKVQMSRVQAKRRIAEEPETPSGAVRRLYRSGRDKVLGGVCGGIAEYLGIDPVVIRILWIIMCFLWGVGILLYIICWIIIPRNPKHRW